MAEIHIKNLWAWWIDELAGLVPERWPVESMRRKKLPEVHFAESAFSLGGVGAGSADDVSNALGRRRRTVLLSIPESDCLIRTLRLPPLAAHRISQILDLDILRITPFARRDVLSGWFRKSGDEIAHVIVRRRLTDAAIEQLLKSGLTVTGIVVNSGTGTRLPLLLEPDEGRARKRKTQAWGKAAFASGCAFLAGSCAWGWIQFTKQAERLAALEERISIIQAQAKSVRSKLGELQSRSSELSSLKARKLSAPRPLAIWDELSAVLPDSAWLQTLAIGGNAVSVEGLAARPEELIALIEKSPLFANASLASAVSNVAGEGQARFAIRADIEKRPSP